MTLSPGKSEASPKKSRKKVVKNKENPKAIMPALNFRKLSKPGPDDIYQLPHLSANTAIGGRRTRCVRSTQRSTNVTPKNGIVI